MLSILGAWHDYMRSRQSKLGVQMTSWDDTLLGIWQPTETMCILKSPNFETRNLMSGLTHSHLHRR